MFTKGKQNSLFPVGPLTKCLLYLPSQQYNKLQQQHLLTKAGKKNCGFKVYTLITCEPKFKLLFPLRVSDFYCPRELVNFDF